MRASPQAHLCRAPRCDSGHSRPDSVGRCAPPRALESGAGGLWRRGRLGASKETGDLERRVARPSPYMYRKAVPKHPGEGVQLYSCTSRRLDDLLY